MSKALEERLKDAKTVLDNVTTALNRHPGRLADAIEKQFRRIAGFAPEVAHWSHMLAARETARQLLANLEGRADGDDEVFLGSTSAKFQTARLLGVQGYLAAQWSLADCLVRVVGHVFCVRSSLDNPREFRSFRTLSGVGETKGQRGQTRRLRPLHTILSGGPSVGRSRFPTHFETASFMKVAKRDSSRGPPPPRASGFPPMVGGGSRTLRRHTVLIILILAPETPGGQLGATI